MRCSQIVAISKGAHHFSLGAHSTNLVNLTSLSSNFLDINALMFNLYLIHIRVQIQDSTIYRPQLNPERYYLLFEIKFWTVYFYYISHGIISCIAGIGRARSCEVSDKESAAKSDAGQWEQHKEEMGRWTGGEEVLGTWCAHLKRKKKWYLGKVWCVHQEKAPRFSKERVCSL